MALAPREAGRTSRIHQLELLALGVELRLQVVPLDRDVGLGQLGLAERARHDVHWESGQEERIVS